MAKQTVIEQDELWRGRIERRTKFLEDTANRNHWERYIDEYTGDYSELLGHTSRVLPLNLIYAFVRAQIPDLYLQDPYFEFTPKKRTTIGSAKLKEIAVNDMWHRKKFKREVKKGILDAIVVGHGWYKVGYNAGEGNLEEEDTTEFNAEEEDYFFYRLNWKHILFNDESVDPPFDSVWIAQKFFVPLKEAKANKDWKGSSKLRGIKLTGKEKVETRHNRPRVQQVQGDEEFAELYEIWNKTDQTVLIFSTQKEVGIMNKREWPYEHMQGFPFLYLNLSQVNDFPYGISDVGMGESHVLEKTKLRSAWLEHLKRGNRQLMTTPENFSQESKDAYKNGDDSALLEVEHPENVRAIPYAPFQNDVFGLESRLDDDLSQIWGQRPPDRAGRATTQTRTKFELQQQGVGTTNRLAEKQHVIQDMVEEACEKLSSLLEQYATEPYYVQLTGVPPEEIAEELSNRPSALDKGSITTAQGFTVTDKDLEGPVDVKIKQGSAIPLDQQSKIGLLQELGQMYLQIKQRPTGPFMGALAKMLVEEAGLQELTEALKAEVVWEQQQQQQQSDATERARELQAAQEATKMQLDAEKLTIEREKVESNTQVEMLQIVKDLQIKVAELETQTKANEAAARSKGES